jgi:ABC-type transport system involved in multi-copper enzyme maturation permease subunit
MLWHKSWLETRWRFVIGLAVVVCSAASVVLSYPIGVELLPIAPARSNDSELARQIRESIELSREYRGYIWSHWFAQNLAHMWTLLAVLLGTGGLVTQSARGGALFTLSLPVPRSRLVAIRATTGLVELAALALVPSLVVAALSPAVGERYAIGDAVIHAGCLFVAGAVFFSLTSLLSTVFADIWRPPLLALLAAMILGLSAQVFSGVSRVSVFTVMSAERYFRGGGVPWLGLVVSAAVSAALLHGAVRNIARQDF